MGGQLKIACYSEARRRKDSGKCPDGMMTLTREIPRAETNWEWFEE